MGDHEPTDGTEHGEAGMRHRAPDRYDVFAMAKREGGATLEHLMDALSPLLDRVIADPSRESALALRSELARWVISIHYRQVEAKVGRESGRDDENGVTLEELTAHIDTGSGDR